MSDSQIQAQLDKLQEVLGKAITLDASRKPVTLGPETGVREKPSSSDWQEQHLAYGKSSRDSLPVRPVLVADGPAYEALDDSTLCIGDSLGAEVAFCPFENIERYPEQFIGRRNKPLAQPFFDAIGDRNTWRFFELYLPGDAQQSCLLVPTAQFVRFLEDVNAHLGTELRIPSGRNALHFSLAFGQGATPRPRYIGPRREKPRVLVDNRRVFDEDSAAFDAASEDDRQSWLASWERARVSPTGQRADADQRARLAAKRAAKRRRECEAMLGRVQARLGTSAGDGVCASTGKPAVFVSIDIEVLEEEPRSITEVGIAVLDTRDIRDRDAGPGGILWWEHVKAHHLVVRQYASHVNHKYVQGCPDKFRFGQSIFPNEWDLTDTLTAILDPYTRDAESDVLLVGHGVQCDVRYLAGAGYDVAQALASVDEIDTQILHQAWTAGTQPRRLQRVLSDLGIPYAYLHNAGNDAVYTLRALVTMGVEGPMPTGQTRRRPQLAGEHGLFDTGNNDKKDDDGAWNLW
ncbi:hypothetical protein E4U42_001252 [Claviceps africana]|uniref:Gfd2/YDR514C-like C-terminal domain-containing protein n=1 Tax=Claviceps africana TaxID=83212 RepID=A0A8K0NKE2_9HYPO|nr:hypothetical protein E4U42_001252 [Claviceps africana]